MDLELTYMKIGIAQIKPVKGSIEQNLNNHIKIINKAAEKKADLMMFPELSLTGYEPELAMKLRTTESDKRLDSIQELSDQNKMIIGVGLPTVTDDKIFISMVIFRPAKERITYSKQHLYPTETGIFTAGYNPLVICVDRDHIIAPAICCELSHEEHQRNACQNHATIYIASVLNSVNGVDADIKKLSEIAKRYKMHTFMANYIGHSGGYECAGKSSIWDNKGELIAQLDTETEGILIYDTISKEII